MSTAPAPFDTIPTALRERDRWVVWRREPDPDGGKPTKVPYIAGAPDAPRRKASSVDPTTWRSFPAAVAALQGGDFHGLSYAVAENDGLVFIDLDHCVGPDGALTAAARALVEQFATYAEYSPTDGVHLFAYGSLAGDWHRRDNTEIYWSGRFATMTGRRIDGTPDGPRYVNGPLHALYARLAPPPRPDLPAPGSPGFIGSLLADHEVLAHAAAASNGMKFTALMSGDLFGYGDDESAADLALCGILAWWCGNDTAQMDRIFRGSGRMRAKWDSRRGGSTYGQITLAKACGASVYTPRPEAPPPRSVKFTDVRSPYSIDNHTTVNFTDAPPVVAKLEARIAELEAAAAEKDARIADLAARLETAHGLLDRIETAAPARTIERLEDQLAEERQARRELLELARDTSLRPVSRIVGICTKERGLAYRPRGKLGEAPPVIVEQRIHVGALETETGIARGSFARYIKEVVARGHLHYHIVPEPAKVEGGEPHSVGFISPGDAVPKTVVSLRLQKARETAAVERAKTLADAARQAAKVKELEQALARATLDGCPECGTDLLPTAYYCPSCRAIRHTVDLARIEGGHSSHHTTVNVTERSSNTLAVKFTDGRSPPEEATGDPWLESGDNADF